MIRYNYKAGDDCPQCKNGYLKDTGQEKHGDRILKCVSCNWLVRENM